MKSTLIFKTAKSFSEAADKKYTLHMVDIELPQDLVEFCAEKYLILMLQQKLRNSSSNEIIISI